MKTVAIIYGWAEGPWQAKKFKRQLSQNGFKTTDDIRNADIIIGHSLGCYLVPVDARTKTVFLIGLPHWPGRSIVSGLTRKLAREIKYHRRNKGFGWWLNKIAHNALYILARPKMTYYTRSKWYPQNLPDGKKFKVLLIRPSDDTTSHPEIMKLLPVAKDYKFIEIPGGHDDCWMEPAPYIDLLLKELR